MWSVRQVTLIPFSHTLTPLFVRGVMPQQLSFEASLQYITTGHVGNDNTHAKKGEGLCACNVDDMMGVHRV
jgi:hypothetical protein